MPRLLLALFLALAPALSLAGPFLISDPWPATGQQPDTCTAIEQPGPTTRDLTLESTQTGLKYIREDLSDATPGAHTWSITCANQWGSSSAVPFEFAAGAPTAPAGLRLAP